MIYLIVFGRLAQLVEQLTLNQRVRGSNPLAPTTLLKNQGTMSIPSYEEACEAVRTLLEWAGENPDRESLKETPSRFVKLLKDQCRGYQEKPEHYLKKTFPNDQGYSTPIVLKGVTFESLCEHHLALIEGTAHIAYVPCDHIVGLSKLARVVDVFAKRLQIQERFTVQVANTIQTILKPKGVAVWVEASHACLSTRGAHKKGSLMVTSHFTGVFQDNPHLQSFVKP